ncbi:DoxX family protein [Streptomyces sp. NPDC058375]|uniref:DoxX family protein n=1 Tax=Streptomyces sp. NPDC058375 TaxID=3346467 RepID=UPI00365A6D3F
MAVLRRVARPLLAAKFIRDGIAAVRDPALPDLPEDSRSERGTPALASRLPFLPEDPEQLVRLQGAVQLGAGVLLALGRAPRLASAALAVTLVSSALAAGGRAGDDPGARRADLLTDVSLFGGLLIAAADTHGKPSLAYRTRRTAGHASDALTHRAHAVSHQVGNAAGATVHQVGNAAGATVDSVAHSVEAARKRLS